MNVNSLHAGKLCQCLQIGVAISFGRRIRWCCSQSLGSCYGGDGCYMSFTLSAEVLPGVVYHSCKPQRVCFHGSQFHVGVQLPVLFTYAADMQIYVHSTKAFYEFLHANWCLCVGYINLGIWAVVQFRGYAMQVVHTSSRYGYYMPLLVKKAGHFQTNTGSGSHNYDFLLHSGFLESMLIVTGPSLVRLTCMSAPKRPVGISRPSAVPSWRTKYSYSGMAMSGAAARM